MKKMLTIMKPSAIKFSDIKILLQLYAAKHPQLSVFDPYGRLVFDEEYNSPEDGQRVLVNLAGNISEFKGEPLSDFDLIIDFGCIKSDAFKRSLKLRYVNNPEGNMRWLFGKGHLNDAQVFYNVSSFRSNLISIAMKLAGRLGLERFIAHGEMNLISKSPLKLNTYLPDSCERYAMFMGTPGLQRTVVLALQSKGQVTDFMKVATMQDSMKLLRAESLALRSIQQKDWKSFETPVTKELKEPALLLASNIRPKRGQRPHIFSSLQASVVNEMASQSSWLLPLNQCGFWERSANDIWKAQMSQNDSVRELAASVKELRDTIKNSQLVLNHMAHGDFTPWNMYEAKGKLHLYDWELFQQSASALYDVFHFHYQKGILVDRKSFDEIRAEVDDSLRLMGDLISKNNINVELYHKLYLISAVSYFSSVYTHQPLTIQNKWQLRIWKEAVARFTEDEVGHIDCRAAFIEQFNESLKLTPHAYVKFNAAELTELPKTSDLDIALPKDYLEEALEKCSANSLVKRMKTYRKSFMTVVELFFKDGSFLSIDLIHQFKRKEIEMLDIEELIADAEYSEKRVWVPSLKHDMEYAYLFYTLNHASIPLKYYDHFSAHGREEVSVALAHLTHRVGVSFSNLSQVFIYDDVNRHKVMRALNGRQGNVLKNKLNYVLDTVRGMIQRKGFIITFSGVDGVGKSTVIREVSHALESRYRREVVLLRHRPGILPILSAVKHGKAKAEKIAGDVIPRKGANKNIISSTLRFAYYYTDYLIGQCYVYVRYVLRGKVVLYDRYYFDFINDARRSNIQVNPKIAKKLYAMVMKPRLNFFLYADAQTIIHRKKELSIWDILELSANYKKLFEELESTSKYSRYKALENIKLDQTISNILKEFEKVA